MQNDQLIEAFGGRPQSGSAHLSRTLMIDELSLLLQTKDLASKEFYKKAIIDDNCLGKETFKTRVLSFNHLCDLYSLDSSNKLFHLMVKLWKDDPSELPLLAFLCAYPRDYMLRDAVDLILPFDIGTPVSWQMIASVLSKKYPDRFSKATMTSLSQNLNSSLQKTGHLGGTKMKKIRSRAKPMKNALTMACVLAYVSGERGKYLINNEFVQAIDCPKEKAMVLLDESEAKGFVRIKSLGDVFEVQFPILDEVL